MKKYPQVICSGCGQPMPTIHPENFHQICWTDGCLEIVEDSYDECISVRHAIRTQDVWIQKLIDQVQK